MKSFELFSYSARTNSPILPYTRTRHISCSNYCPLIIPFLTLCNWRYLKRSYINTGEMVGKTALTQTVYRIYKYFSSVAFKLCSTDSTKKNTEKSIMVLGGKYPTGNSLINSQKPIFPRSIARLSHSKVH